MGKTMTLTSKGQVTIPKDLRDELGLRPFDRIEIVADGTGGARLRKARLSLEEVAGMFPALGIPVDEIDRVAKEARDEHYADKYG